MAELKTKATKVSAVKFIDAIKDDGVRADCKKISAIMKKAAGEKPVMWGASIVGFGKAHFISKSGREVDWMKTAFSPRKNYISVYIIPGLQKYRAELEKLGKHSQGKGCLYIKKLSDINIAVLTRIINDSVKSLKSGVYRV